MSSASEFPEVSAPPSLSADQMCEVDRVMIEDLHISLLQMMENAGRDLADLALRRFECERVCVLAGSGGNGGGGLVAARHLANRGCEVEVVLSAPERLGEVPAHQHATLERMGVCVVAAPSAAPSLIIDALIGYSLRGDPRGRAAELIHWVNESDAAILSLDTPSGLDVSSGAQADPCVQAIATMTLALPKTGLLGAPAVGELYLADISVPPAVYARLGLEVSPRLFAGGTIIRIR